MKLTPRQLDAIRAMYCALCLAVQPFADGSRCHPHRIVRGKDGGEYVEGNVIPLCPPCHREIDRVVMITAAYKGGQGAARWKKLNPSLATEHGRLGARIENDRKRRDGLTPAQRSQLRDRARRRHEVHPHLSRDIMRRLHQEHPDLSREAGRKGAGKGARISIERRKRSGMTVREVAQRAALRHDIGGRRFGRLLALRDTGSNTWHARLWLCQCDCGNQTVVRSAHLRQGITRSCGCLQREAAVQSGMSTAADLSGQRFGRLVAVRDVGRNRGGQRLWLCQCDCGGRRTAIVSVLRSGNTQSCGCLRREMGVAQAGKLNAARRRTA